MVKESLCCSSLGFFLGEESWAWGGEKTKSGLRFVGGRDKFVVVVVVVVGNDGFVRKSFTKELPWAATAMCVCVCVRDWVAGSISNLLSSTSGWLFWAVNGLIYHLNGFERLLIESCCPFSLSSHPRCPRGGLTVFLWRRERERLIYVSLEISFFLGCLYLTQARPKIKYNVKNQ